MKCVSQPNLAGRPSGYKFCFTWLLRYFSPSILTLGHSSKWSLRYLQFTVMIYFPLTIGSTVPIKYTIPWLEIEKFRRQFSTGRNLWVQFCSCWLWSDSKLMTFKFEECHLNWKMTTVYMYKCNGEQFTPHCVLIKVGFWFIFFYCHTIPL